MEEEQLESRPGRVVMVSNLKGGVGKTSNAVTIAAALADMGQKCLLIDIDPTPNLSLWLGAPTEGGWPTSFEFMTRAERHPSECIITDENPEVPLPKNIHVIPGSAKLNGLHDWVLNQKYTLLHELLAEQVNAVKHDYDWVFIDAPPHVSDASAAAMWATDYIILSTFPEPAAVKQLLAAWGDVETAQEAGLKVSVLGIVMSSVRYPPTRLAQELSRQISQVFQLTDGSTAKFSVDIGHAVAFSEAWAVGKTIFQYEPEHKLCEAYRQVAKECMERVEALEGLSLTPEAPKVVEALGGGGDEEVEASLESVTHEEAVNE